MIKKKGGNTQGMAVGASREEASTRAGASTSFDSQSSFKKSRSNSEYLVVTLLQMICFLGT